MQFSCAFPAQPHEHSGSVYPIEGGYFYGYLQSILTMQALQGLHEKHSVVNITVRPMVTVDTFAFIKELPFHRD